MTKPLTIGNIGTTAAILAALSGLMFTTYVKCLPDGVPGFIQDIWLYFWCWLGFLALPVVFGTILWLILCVAFGWKRA